MDAATSPRRFALALLGLALVVAAPLAYVAFVSHPTAARTGWPMFAVGGVGLALARVAALGDRRWRTRVGATLAVLVGIGWAWLFFGALRVPSGPMLATAPDFTLADPSGQPVSLAQERAKGPVLLVFYRGWW